MAPKRHEKSSILTQRLAFLQELPLMFYRAHEVGLHATAQLIHEAVRKSGYELAELMVKEEGPDHVRPKEGK